MSQLSDKILSYNPQIYRPFSDTTVSASAIKYGTLTADTIVLNGAAGQWSYAADGPIGGTQDSWNLQKVLSVLDTRVRHTQATSIAAVNDKDFSLGFWVKWMQFPTNTSVSANILFGGSGAISATSPGFLLAYAGTGSTQSRKLAIQASNGTAVTVTYSANTIPNDTNWHYIAIRRSGTIIEVYFDGQLYVTATNPITTASTGDFYYGGVSAFPQSAFNLRLSHFYLTPYSIINATAISEIYIAGSTAPVLNKLKYWNGTAWTNPLSITQWDGTSWTTFNGKVWTGSAWEAIT